MALWKTRLPLPTDQVATANAVNATPVTDDALPSPMTGTPAASRVSVTGSGSIGAAVSGTPLARLRYSTDSGGSWTTFTGAEVSGTGAGDSFGPATYTAVLPASQDLSLVQVRAYARGTNTGDGVGGPTSAAATITAWKIETPSVGGIVIA